MDFDHQDGTMWPMRIQEGGGFYGFCPAKATWDKEAISLYNVLVLSYETKNLLYSGGIAEQPGWFIDLLSWFVTRYDESKFYSRATAILGSSKKGQNIADNKATANNRSNSRLKGRNQRS